MNRKKVIGLLVLVGLAAVIVTIGVSAFVNETESGTPAPSNTVQAASDALVKTLDAQLAAQGGFVAQTRCVVLVAGKPVPAQRGSDFACVVDARAATAPGKTAACAVVTFSFPPGAKEPTNLKANTAAPSNCSA